MPTGGMEAEGSGGEGGGAWESARLGGVCVCVGGLVCSSNRNRMAANMS